MAATAPWLNCFCMKSVLAQTMPLFAPIPQDPSLAQLCKDFLSQPNIQSTPERWAGQINKSLRSFLRACSGNKPA